MRLLGWLGQIIGCNHLGDEAVIDDKNSPQI